MRPAADRIQIRKKSEGLLRKFGVDRGIVQKVEDRACDGRGGRVGAYGIDGLDVVAANIAYNEAGLPPVIKRLASPINSGISKPEP